MASYMIEGYAVAQLGTALQAFKFPMVSLEFFIDVILPAPQWPCGRLQPLTEMSTRNISLGGGGAKTVGE